jgi:hypothetical protein
MARLIPETMQDLQDVLEPVIGDTPKAREGLLFMALGDSPVLRQVAYDGPISDYIPHMIKKLRGFGRIESGIPALQALLKHVRGEVGFEGQSQIDTLLEKLYPPVQEVPPPKPAPPPEKVLPSADVIAVIRDKHSTLRELHRPPEEVKPRPKPSLKQLPVSLDEEVEPVELSPEDAARDYLACMKPVPPDTPQFYMASCLVSNNLYYHFVCANKYWHPAEGKCKAQGDVDDSYLKHWGNSEPSDKRRNLPVTNISFRAAGAFAVWLSKLAGHTIRLPRFEEWQMAVSAGRANWLEEEILAGRVNYCLTSSALRAVHAYDENPFGIRDLLGNAHEICTSLNRPRLLVGGCYHSTEYKLQEQISVDLEEECLPDASFRCVRDI